MAFPALPADPRFYSLLLCCQFAYPFTLEPHVVTLESARQSTVTAHAARRESYLKMREDAKTQRKKDALRRVAPGFEPDSGPMVPKRVGQQNATRIEDLTVKSGTAMEPRSVMDDLVDQLAAMSSNK